MRHRDEADWSEPEPWEKPGKGDLREFLSQQRAKKRGAPRFLPT